MLKRFIIAISILLFLAAPAAGQELIVLSPDIPELEFPIAVMGGGETCVVLTMSSQDTSWDSRPHSSVILHAAIDGEFANAIVVFGGGQILEYTLCAGPLSPGEHTLKLMLARDISPAKQGSVTIYEIAARTFLHQDSAFFLYEFSPFLYERAAEQSTDVSLKLFANPVSDQGRTTIEYHVVLSNEDGGTGRNPAILMSRYGRTTDIEWVYRVVVDEATGDIISEQYQGSGHDTRDFTGRKIGRHPVLRVATDNGNFEQDGETPVRVGLLPVRFAWGGEQPREAIMDAFPWMHRIASEEMFAENKATRNYNSKSAQLGDMRDYVYIDYHAQNLNGEKTLSFEVQLKGGKHWYSTNPGKDVPFLGDDGLLAFSGWMRTNIKLPPGTKTGDIQSLRILGAGNVSYEIMVVKAFMLDDFYLPQTPFFELPDKVILSPENRQFIYRIEPRKQ
jgi:hypothetical protein